MKNPIFIFCSLFMLMNFSVQASDRSSEIELLNEFNNLRIGNDPVKLALFFTKNDSKFQNMITSWHGNVSELLYINFEYYDNFYKNMILYSAKFRVNPESTSDEDKTKLKNICSLYFTRGYCDTEMMATMDLIEKKYDLEIPRRSLYEIVSEVYPGLVGKIQLVPLLVMYGMHKAADSRPARYVLLALLVYLIYQTQEFPDFTSGF
jgi:hypothetical protein